MLYFCWSLSTIGLILYIVGQLDWENGVNDVLFKRDRVDSRPQKETPTQKVDTTSVVSTFDNVDQKHKVDISQFTKKRRSDSFMEQMNPHFEGYKNDYE